MYYTKKFLLFFILKINQNYIVSKYDTKIKSSVLLFRLIVPLPVMMKVAN